MADARPSAHVAQFITRDELDALAADVGRLAVAVAEIQCRQRPRDEADAAVLVALRAIVGIGGDFNARDVFAHGRLQQTFKALLAEAGVETRDEAGYMLRRLTGSWAGGAQLTRLRRDGAGTRWAFIRA